MRREQMFARMEINRNDISSRRIFIYGKCGVWTVICLLYCVLYILCASERKYIAWSFDYSWEIYTTIALCFLEFSQRSRASLRKSHSSRFFEDWCSERKIADDRVFSRSKNRRISVSCNQPIAAGFLYRYLQNNGYSRIDELTAREVS